MEFKNRKVIPTRYFKKLQIMIWRYIYSIATILGKDLKIEFRSKELITTLVVFNLLVILIFNFTIELEPTMRLIITPGVLWVTFLFAGTLGVNRSFSGEKDRGCLDGLLLAPIEHTTIFFGKMLSNLLLMLLVEMIILPIYSILYNINLFNFNLILVIFLGSVGFITVGTLFSSITMHTRSKDLFLPILLFPVIIPVLLAAVKASQGLLVGRAWQEISPWINLMVVYDLIFFSISFMFFDYLVAD